ncbi:MAG TPA: hypothetical protein DCO75_13515, partial [Fibrobacteres bacterium]|nr:hypothetical protein [Fibrobacterota bacterium]
DAIQNNRINANNSRNEAGAAQEQLKITFPYNGYKCGQQLRVQGTSTKIPGKYLWVFVHRSDIMGWWPQTNAVKIRADGTWLQTVGIGQPQDIDFEFEIKAIWLNEADHNNMVQYMRDGTKNNDWPSIELPEGSPSAIVTVTKVK